MSAEVERISQLFKNVNISHQRRGSDSGNSHKSFQLGPITGYTHAHTGSGGTPNSRFHREGATSPAGFINNGKCQVHVPTVGLAAERRGSTGNISWRKGSTGANGHAHLHSHAPGQYHHHPPNIPHNLHADWSRRGSTPGDVLLFPRKDSRKFSQDSIELNESSKHQHHWEHDGNAIIEEENEGGGSNEKPKFQPVTTIEDIQAIRCAEFHPRGHVYAIGSNSKALRICAYPDTSKVTETQVAKSPNILFKRNKHHRGSIYCLGWSPDGNLLATGSNDKTVKLTRFDETRNEFGNSQEVELTMHDGTVRDICFIEDLSNKSSLLVSGGAGDCKIYVTDCVTATPFQALSGHSGPVSSLYNWGGVMFCSGSQDKTIRVWDLRTRGCVNMISPLTHPNSLTLKSPVGSVCVDPTGRLLISGHEDSAVVLYDLRGNRQVQIIKPHSGDVRSVRFSPNAYYLLSAGYDNRLMLTDLQGDLTMPLSSVAVAQHDDKAICGRWHPNDFSFLSTSADKTCTLWALPAPT